MMPAVSKNFVQYPPNMLTLVLMEGPNSQLFHFPVMPESVNYVFQYLSNLTVTEGGAWVDEYGRAPSPLTVQGTFGYNTKAYLGALPLTGFAWTKMLRRIVDKSHYLSPSGKVPRVYLLDWYSQEFQEVRLDNFGMQQTTTRNLIWIYRMQMTMLGPMSSGSPLADALLKSVASVVMGMLEGRGSTVKELASIFV